MEKEINSSMNQTDCLNTPYGLDIPNDNLLVSQSPHFSLDSGLHNYDEDIPLAIPLEMSPEIKILESEKSLKGANPDGNNFSIDIEITGNQDTVPLVGFEDTDLLHSQNGRNFPDCQLSPDILEIFRQEAIARWSQAGLDEQTLHKLNQIKLTIADLPGSQVGLASGEVIMIDQDAGGKGWFIDPTPTDDVEFTSSVNNQLFGKVDLLSVVAHEMGHILGLPHINSEAQFSSLMSPVLSTQLM